MNGKMDLVVSGRKVVTPQGLRPASIFIRDGVIAEVGPLAPAPQGKAVLEAGNLVVMPGLVDTHVHVNEPGRTQWEGFETATKSAASGGITTLVDMPLNCIPVTTTAAALKTKLAAAKGGLWIDCGFWGGVVPGNAHELEAMIAAGALGFKAFLIHSGIDEFPNASEADLRAAMPILAERGLPLLVHAELETRVSSGGGDARRYENYLHSRPKSWENEAVSLMTKLCAQTGCRTHIVHLSSSEALDSLRMAREEKLPLTAETCPHYLYFAAEEISSGRTEFKCSPPIREKGNRERLWEGLRTGLIDFIVSDHSPCTPDLKRQDSGDFAQAWGGVSSLQFALPAAWTQAKRRGFSLENLTRWMCERPAEFAGLQTKGFIAPGFDADLVLWDPETSFTVSPDMIRHKHKLTPYAGEKLDGVVDTTILRGETAYSRGSFPAPRGKLLLNSDRRIAST